MSYIIERTVKEILDWFEKCKLTIPRCIEKSVDYFKWTDKQMSVYIDNILNGYYINPIVITNNDVLNADGKTIEHYNLISGVEKLGTLIIFTKNNLRINLNNDFHSKYNHSSFEDLDKETQEDFLNTNLKILVFDSTDKSNSDLSDEEFIINIFNRYN